MILLATSRVLDPAQSHRFRFTLVRIVGIQVDGWWVLAEERKIVGFVKRIHATYGTLPNPMNTDPAGSFVGDEVMRDAGD
jgi:hypothetical protein